MVQVKVGFLMFFFLFFFFLFGDFGPIFILFFFSSFILNISFDLRWLGTINLEIILIPYCLCLETDFEMNGCLSVYFLFLQASLAWSGLKWDSVFFETRTFLLCWFWLYDVYFVFLLFFFAFLHMSMLLCLINFVSYFPEILVS